MENIIFNESNGIAEVIINRPKALNALNNQTITELGEVINEISKRKDIKTVIITGAGEKAFVAGADIVEMKDLKFNGSKRFFKISSEGIFRYRKYATNCNSCC